MNKIEKQKVLKVVNGKLIVELTDKAVIKKKKKRKKRKSSIQKKTKIKGKTSWTVKFDLRPPQAESFKILEEIDAKIRDFDERNVKITLGMKEEILLNFLCLFPTGAGKTLVGEKAVNLAYERGKKSIWTVPLKALADQAMKDFGKFYRTLLVTGDTTRDNKTNNMIRNGDWDVIVCTYEKLDIILRSKKKRGMFFKNVGLVVIDEIHSFADKNRGPKLESAILKQMVWYPQVQIVGLSATLGREEDYNIKDVKQNFALWLQARHVYSPPTARPCPLQIKILSYVDVRSNTENDKQMEKHLEELVAEYGFDNKFLVFVRARHHTLEYQSSLTEKFPGLDIRYHHAGISSNITKNKIVNEFNNGSVNGIVATTTLAQGVDTPCQLVIISHCKRWDWLKSQEEFLEFPEFKQMIGRVRNPVAGEKVGLAVAICKEMDVQEVKRRMTKPATLCSQIPDHLEEHMNEWVVSGLYERKQLEWMANRLFNADLSPVAVNEAINWLIKRKFFTPVEGEKALEPTIWGKLTARWMIRPRTTLYFKKCGGILREWTGKPSPMNIFALVLDTNEYKENIVVRNTNSDNKVVHYGMKYLDTTQRVDDRIAKGFAMTFAEWINIMEATQGNRHVNIGHSDGDVHVLKKASRRLFGSAKVITSLVKNPWQEEVQKTYDMIECECFDKTFFKFKHIDGIGKTYMQRLFSAGIRTLEEFLEKSTHQLINIMSPGKRKLKPDKIEEFKIQAIDLLSTNT